MPIIPPTSFDYDPLETILNFARVIANDAQVSLAGDLLADSQPYTFTLANLAWRKLQDRLGNNGIEEFPQEVQILNIPPVNQSVQTDPGVQVYIGGDGYWDGADLKTNIILPSDMEIPLKLWERSSSNPPGNSYIPMTPASGGLPTWPKTSLNLTWEWRDDAIYMPGSLATEDLRIRYKRVLSDFPNDSATPVPILRCAVALAYLMVETFAQGRGGVPDSFTSEKELAIKQLINSTTRKRQGSNYRRIPYSRRGSNFNW